MRILIVEDEVAVARQIASALTEAGHDPKAVHDGEVADRKSTRLNSSHSQISYAVFCLKKKNINSYVRRCDRIMELRRASSLYLFDYHAHLLTLGSVSPQFLSSDLLASRDLAYCSPPQQ